MKTEYTIEAKRKGQHYFIPLSRRGWPTYSESLKVIKNFKSHGDSDETLTYRIVEQTRKIKKVIKP